MTEEWEFQSFLEAHCNDSLQIIRTPVYTIPLIKKLLETVSFVTNTSSRRRSLRLIEDMLLSNYLDTVYATIDKETTLKYFRRCALELLISQTLVAGELLTKKLVRLSLQHNDAWYQLLQLFDQALRQNQHRILLSILYVVLCDINEGDIHHQFTAFLEPAVRRNGQQFHAMLVTLLRQDNGGDDRPFVILRFFHHVFTHPGYRTALMEAAIMSPIFNYPFDHRTLASAISVRVCIEHDVEFALSPTVMTRLNDIVLLLRNRRSQREAERLAATLTRIRIRSRY